MIKIFDLHTDILTSNCKNTNIAKKIKKDKKSGYMSINAIFRGELTFEKALRIAKSAKKSGVDYIAFEDCCYEDFILKKSGVNADNAIAELVCELAGLKPEYISLGWNYDNLFAGGCKGSSPLTEMGKTFIKSANKYKIPIDLAHLNKSSFLKAADESEKILCSHTAIDNVYKHIRNIDFDMIDIILKRGGIVGLTTVGYFITENQSVNYDINKLESAFYEHIAAYLEKFGSSGLCIGSDFFGTDLPAFKNGDYQNFCMRFIDTLKKSGARKDDIEKILYKNACEFFKITV